MTKRLVEMYALALSLELDEPLGRAVYALNRRYNGGYRWRSDEQIMRAAKATTAVRWREHWNNGGALRSLSRQRPDAVVAIVDDVQPDVQPDWPPAVRRVIRAINLNR